ncbi:MAG: hypothetical protein GX640_23310 [Fibrobacter sp.]|nr:hypothetical protein [Fibrobacter sp.]
MAKKKLILLICIFIYSQVFAYSSEFLKTIDRNGFFFRGELGCESSVSHSLSFSGTILAGKYFNEFTAGYIGFQMNNGENPFTSIFAGSELILFIIQNFELIANVESEIDFNKDFRFTPGITFKYNFISNNRPMTFSFTFNQHFQSKDTSWNKDDTQTITIDESRTKKIFYPEAEVKLGYVVEISSRQNLHFFINHFTRLNPMPGEQIFDLGALSVCYSFKYNKYLQIQTTFDFDIPQNNESLKAGFKIALATY